MTDQADVTLVKSKAAVIIRIFKVNEHPPAYLTGSIELILFPEIRLRFFHLFGVVHLIVFARIYNFDYYCDTISVTLYLGVSAEVVTILLTGIAPVSPKTLNNDVNVLFLDGFFL